VRVIGSCVKLRVIAKQCDANDYWEFGNFPEVNCCKAAALSAW